MENNKYEINPDGVSYADIKNLIKVFRSTEYDSLENKNLNYFKDRITNFDNILAELYINWQKQYLENFND